MESFMFLSQYRDTKAIFYLFYKITKGFSSFGDIIHVSVLQYKMKMTWAMFVFFEREWGSTNQSVRRTRVIL